MAAPILGNVACGGCNSAPFVAITYAFQTLIKNASTSLLLFTEVEENSWLRYILLVAISTCIIVSLFFWKTTSPPANMDKYPTTLEIQSYVLGSDDGNTPLSLSGPEEASLAPLFEPPLSTCGSSIIDATNSRFKLISVNWYGASDELFIPSGLDVRQRSLIARTIRKIGFNSVRLPYADELVVRNPLVPTHLLKANADLLSADGTVHALDVFAAVVQACTDVGLAVIINNHITTARWCCDGNLCDAKWFNNYLPAFLCPLQQTEDDWIANLITIMRPHISNPLVIGVDLRNEVRGPSNGLLWNSWATAAERAAAKLHEMNAAWLMIVEGVCSANDLSGARLRPVKLSVPNKLVYSAHVYGWSGWGSLKPYWYTKYAAFAKAMDKNWGFLVTEDIAPVWVGEFGNPGIGQVTFDRKTEGPSMRDMNYWDNLIRYLGECDADFGYWALNPRKPHKNEFETYGLLDDDWETVRWDYRLWDMARLARKAEQR